MPQTILVVDDKKELRVMVQSYLEEEGFRVVLASDGQEALYVARHEKPDLIILDLMMPNMGGYDFLKAHKREADTPIVILTARLEESDKILGLELGADDFVTKPFSMRELTARAPCCAAPPAPRCSLTCCGSPTSLSTAPAARFPWKAARSNSRRRSSTCWQHFAAPGRAFTRAELLDRLQGDAFDGYERTIDVHIRNLRTKLEPNPSKPRYVETVYGVGYRFAEE
ncbi:MAG: response regulator transcription factor [Caldilineales bacterium]